MDFNSSTVQGIDIDFDPISESEVEDLIGNASSELQDLVAGLSVSVKQILKIMSKVLGETADYIILSSEDVMESASLCLDLLLSSDDESLMALSALCA